MPLNKTDCENVSVCVPHCSVLERLLFLIYINDIVKDMKSVIKLFAGDTNNYVLVPF